MCRALGLPLNSLYNITKVFYFICISSYYQCFFTGSFPCPDWPLTVMYPSQLLPSNCESRTNIRHASTRKVFCSSSFQLLFHFPTFPPPMCTPLPFMHYSCTPQNTFCVSLHFHIMHFTRRRQPCLWQRFCWSVLQTINILINAAKSVTLQALQR